MTRIPWLNKPSEFPATHRALRYPNGLLAAGGQLSPQWLLSAYRQGIFPWFDAEQPILWWSPSPRCVLFPDELHISKSLSKTLRKGKFSFSFDREFDQVIRGCALPRSYTAETWISQEMIVAYTELHSLGYAHSVEAWYEGELAGGLYGLQIGQVYFGESMFSKVTDASKACFVALVEKLAELGVKIIDCQVTNPHLLSLGAREIPRRAFEEILLQSIDGESKVGSWSEDTQDTHL